MCPSPTPRHLGRGKFNLLSYPMFLISKWRVWSFNINRLFRVEIALRECVYACVCVCVFPPWLHGGMFKDSWTLCLRSGSQGSEGFMLDCFSDWCRKKNALEREYLISKVPQCQHHLCLFSFL